MSDTPTPGAAAVKKRRLQGACDICRIKKGAACARFLKTVHLTIFQLNASGSNGSPMQLMDSPGDSGNMPGGVCSNCITSGAKCTHLTGKRTQAKIAAIPQDALQLDPLLLSEPGWATTLPDLKDYASTSSKAFDISTGAASQDNGGNVQSTLLEFSEYIKVLEARLSSKVANESELETEPELLETEDNTDAVLADYMNLMTMSTSRDRFYGKSSNVTLLKTASAVISKAGLRSRPNTKRQQMWEVYPWQIMQELRPPFLMFPEQDLMQSLIDLYFAHWNLFLPLLHRPSFEKSLSEGLYHRNYYFGATVLVVCALGSKFSDDSRVFLDGIREQSCGWIFFSQVQPLQGTSLVSPPSLYELQYYSLSVLFLHGSSVIESSWAVLGIALRLAQDVGLHRKMNVKPEVTADNESWKRVFWCLAAMDPLASSAFGRPLGLNSDDFDQEYPLECDDEYWVHSNPKMAFKQPEGRPSTISHFVSYLKLVRILETAHRTLYAANSSIPGKQAVSQLDEALAQWMDSIPQHLRWDPNRKDLLFFKQSGSLYTTYYYIKMLVHEPVHLGSSSHLAIVVDSGKRCIDVLEHLSRRAPLGLTLVHVALITSATMLLTSHWKNPSEFKDLDDVRRCLKLLKSQQSRWHIAGVLCDTITPLVAYADNHESPYVQVSRKRPQEESWDSQLSNQTFASPDPSAASKSKIGFEVGASPTFTPPTLPDLNLPPDTTKAEIERLLQSTNLPDFGEMDQILELLPPED
ncbi:fungal-specific transcription factor domain-containing protein [Mycena floridula]|nr:fungal-specific transcription factor domain-containing protein [Mycena floridula]